MKYHIAWNEARSVGVICKDEQMAYELRKGSTNTLGIVSAAFSDAWGDMTVDDNCEMQAVDLPAPATRELLAELRLWRNLVTEGGVPRYTITPGAALNTIVTSTDALIRKHGGV